jgi:Carboxypeptidase regulatory-like domain
MNRPRSVLFSLIYATVTLPYLLARFPAAPLAQPAARLFTLAAPNLGLRCSGPEGPGPPAARDGPKTSAPKRPRPPRGVLRLIIQFPELVPNGVLDISASRLDPATHLYVAVENQVVPASATTTAQFRSLDPGLYRVRLAITGLLLFVQVTVLPQKLATAQVALSPIRLAGHIMLRENPVAGANVRVICKGQSILSTRTGFDGGYGVTLWSSGTYELQVTLADGSTPFVVPLAVAPGVRRLEKDLAVPTGSLRGWVRDAKTGAPITGAKILYTSTAGSSMPFQFTVSTLSARDGEFKLDNLPANMGTLTAQAAGYVPSGEVEVFPVQGGALQDLYLQREPPKALGPAPQR